MNVGIIDVGSNSVRLLYDGKKYVKNTQLSKNQLPGGPLCETSMTNTYDAVKKFVDFVRENGGEVKIFATEAVRSASNRNYFVSLLEGLNVKVDVLSPEREALIGFTGTYFGNGKTQAVLDVGGASSELIVGSDKGITYSHSLPLGSVRTRDLGLCPPELKVAVSQRVLEYGEVPAFSQLVSIGGTTSTLVAIKKQLKNYDRDEVHLSVLTYDEILDIVEYINSVPMRLRKYIAGLPYEKRDVIPAGGILVAEIMKYLGTTELIVSENDNLEGYLSLFCRNTATDK